MNKNHGQVASAGLILLCCTLASLSLFGGSSRVDEPLLLFARVGAIIGVCVAWVLLSRDQLRVVRTPLLFMLALAIMITAQLVPLPPAIWQALPGMDEVVAASRLAGTMENWRPLSLAPAATFNSLMSLLPATAMILCYALLEERHRKSLPIIIVVIAALSVVVAGLQVGGISQLYHYRITNMSVPTGLMANRNHQALLLAFSIPAIAAIAMNRTRGAVPQMSDLLVSGLAFVVVLAMMVSTGSRAGLLLAVVATGLAAFYVWSLLKGGAKRQGSPSRLVNIGGAAVLLGAFAIIAAAMGSGGNSFTRLGEVEVEGDQRMQVIPQLIELSQKFFPFGSGFGSFPDVFQIIEPDDQLNTAYFNNAHNDFAQVIIEGGVVGAAIVIVGLVIGVRASLRLVRVIRTRSRKTSGAEVGLLLVAVGTFITSVIASLFDYPLRTPLIGGLLALAGCIVCDRRLNAGPVVKDIVR